MAEFEAAFPYEETPDQLTAIEATKHDMAQPKPMDRLICGDVGYGKTEIAMRAAFKAVDAGKQVAVLVPTTILAEQHHRSFSARMAEFPFNIEVVNRFRPRSEIREVLKRTAAGGRRHPDRHAPDLCRRTSVFKDLGLVVIDEEQRFGVEDKEWLKTLPLDGRRAHALGHADPAHPAHEPAGHPRHLQPGDAAAGPQGDRDADPPLRRRDDQAARSTAS